VAYECTIDQELAEHCCMGAGRRLLFTLFCVFGRDVNKDSGFKAKDRTKD